MNARRFPGAVLFLICMTLCCAAIASAESAEATAKSRTFELPLSIGAGEGREVSVLLDESHLKLATVSLRDGTVLPVHSTPVPATILVLVGEGVIHVGSEAVSVSKGTIVSLAAGEEHDVVPAPGSDMLLLVHYLRGDGDKTPTPGKGHADHEH